MIGAIGSTNKIPATEVFQTNDETPAEKRFCQFLFFVAVWKTRAKNSIAASRRFAGFFCVFTPFFVKSPPRMAMCDFLRIFHEKTALWKRRFQNEKIGCVIVKEKAHASAAGFRLSAFIVRRMGKIFNLLVKKTALPSENGKIELKNTTLPRVECLYFRANPRCGVDKPSVLWYTVKE